MILHEYKCLSTCQGVVFFIPHNVLMASHPQDPRQAQLREMFSRLAGDDNEIDAEELQDILTASLTKGKASHHLIVCSH